MRRLFAVVLTVLCSVSLSVAQTPSTTRQIPYAGTALDDTGAPLTGEVALTLELYEDQEGGTPLWRERQRVQTDPRGRYLAYLGAVRPLPQAAFTQERARWLSVSINSRPVPRVKLVAVPYALRAADADTLGGQPASSFVRSRADGRLETSAGVVAVDAVDGTGVPGQLAKWVTSTFQSSSIISESATNRIGVGLPDPTGGGVVDSVFTIRNFDNNTGLALLNDSQARRFALNTLATGGWTLYDGGTNRWNRGLTQLNGNLGIGTTSPASPLDVRGAAGLSAPVVASFATGAGVLGAAVSGTADSFVTNTSAAGIFGQATGTCGHAGGFVSNNNCSTVRIDQGGIAPALEVIQFGSNPVGDIVLFRGIAANIVAGINKAGRGTFNGGGDFGGGVSVTGHLTTTGNVTAGGEVTGASPNNVAVRGNSADGVGTMGQSITGVGVFAVSQNGPGLYAESSVGFAGEFAGDVAISGTLIKGGGSFKIDHPLDPTNRYLSHSFVESPDMMNVYNGNATLDSTGEAWVALPEWFEALNRDFRYQLTAIGAPGPNLYVATKVSGNRFKIAGGTPGGEVSWQVTGVRQDAWANAHRIAVEEKKPEAERGSYLHPREYGHPESVAAKPSLSVRKR